MKFIILASGSKGNSTLVINDNKELLLIDVGIPFKEIKEKINRYGYDINDIKNVLITHEHEDHIKSINCFSNVNKYSLKDISIVNMYLEKYEEENIEGYKVRALPLSHDVKCCGFVIECDNEKLVYITDTGYINQRNIEYIRNADYYVFESNHNVKMLMETSRPFYIKSRILGDVGHLSNETASELLCDVIGERTKQIYLAHISSEANTKKRAIEAFCNEAKDRNIDINNIVVSATDQNIELVGGNNNEKVTISS